MYKANRKANLPELYLLHALVAKSNLFMYNIIIIFQILLTTRARLACCWASPVFFSVVIGFYYPLTLAKRGWFCFSLSKCFLYFAQNNIALDTPLQLANTPTHSHAQTVSADDGKKYVYEKCFIVQEQQQQRQQIYSKTAAKFVDFLFAADSHFQALFRCCYETWDTTATTTAAATTLTLTTTATATLLNGKLSKCRWQPPPRQKSWGGCTFFLFLCFFLDFRFFFSFFLFLSASFCYYNVACLQFAAHNARCHLLWPIRWAAKKTRGVSDLWHAEKRKATETATAATMWLPHNAAPSSSTQMSARFQKNWWSKVFSYKVRYFPFPKESAINDWVFLKTFT